MRYWFDTEFIEDSQRIDLISIGIVAEDGREYYAINEQCQFYRASNWVWENVLNPIGITQSSPKSYIPCISDEANSYFQPKKDIKTNILKFCNPKIYSTPEFWAYYADYDWVVFCQLFGTMMDLPDGFPMYCNDIKQEHVRLGSPALPKQEQREHNALENARWNKRTWEFLINYEASDRLPESLIYFANKALN